MMTVPISTLAHEAKGGWMMEVILKHCAGLDVHKKSISVCIRTTDAKGGIHKHFRTFGTMTRNLLDMLDWLSKFGVTHVAMESTGVLWKPVYNILENFFEILLCNAKKLKHVPGRKTDMKDCEWIAQLLQHGLLSGSFIPPRPQRDLRDLTRHRAQLAAEKTRQVNRIHKVLEDANIKLGTVATDVMGTSGRDMLKAIIGGEDDPGKLAQFARGRLRRKAVDLELALEGKVSEHHRFLLKMHLEHVEYLERQIEELTRRIEDCMVSEELNRTDENARGGGPVPFAEAQEFLMDIPGLNEISIQAILAEIGTDMNQFPSSQKLTSWSRICPGSHESAGKRKNVSTGQGNRWLKSVLCQCAWSASHTKDTYFSAQYKRLAKKRGKRRAMIAVAHSLLTIIYHMIKKRSNYKELGADFFDSLNPERIVRYHVKRIESFGFTVSLEADSVAA
jgi:transposase